MSQGCKIWTTRASRYQRVAEAGEGGAREEYEKKDEEEEGIAESFASAPAPFCVYFMCLARCSCFPPFFSLRVSMIIRCGRTNTVEKRRRHIALAFNFFILKEISRAIREVDKNDIPSVNMHNVSRAMMIVDKKSPHGGKY